MRYFMLVCALVLVVSSAYAEESCFVHEDFQQEADGCFLVHLICDQREESNVTILCKKSKAEEMESREVQRMLDEIDA